MKPMKRIIAYFLSGLVLIFSAIAILGIWEVIDLDYLLSKMFKSIMVIFVASAVIVFIFSLLIRESQQED